MTRNAFQRLVSLKGPGSAVSKLTRATTCEAAPRHSKMPQSQPMQRSTETQLSDSESEGTSSPPSDEELAFESASSTAYSSTSPLPTHIPPEGLHSPPKPNDPALLRTSQFAHVSYILVVAEILTESIVTLDDGWCFTPSPDEQYLLNYDYTEEQGTVIALHSLVKRASLPVDTFILAALILRHLKPEFYDEWCELMSDFQPVTSYDDERTREVVIVAAIVRNYFLFSNNYLDYRSKILTRCYLYINDMVRHCLRG